MTRIGKVGVAGTLSVCALLAFAGRAAAGQDPVKVAPDKCKVLLENDDVRVYEFILKPGEKMPMHSHPRTSIYSLTDAKLKISTPDGATQDAEFKAGQAYFHGPVTHEGVNVGTTDCHFIISEIKPPHPKTQ
jgi:quercetin dioxygenase-like cupin family protein